MKLLHIDSAITGPMSVSRELSALIVEQLAGADKHDVVYRDLVAENISHFTAVTAPSSHPLSNAVPSLDPAQQAERAKSDAILQEFLEADTVVIGAPMYNFTIASQLKAWMDRLIVPGTTFQAGEAGPEGLVGPKNVFLVLSRGGIYGSGIPFPFSDAEYAESLLRSMFTFIGVTNITSVVAEGVMMPDLKDKAIASAREKISEITF
jgi:FMN-dependent NADH-azoreductase